MKNEIYKRPKSGKPFLLSPLKYPIKTKNNEAKKTNILMQNGLEKVKKIDNYNAKLNYLNKFDDMDEKMDKLKNIDLIEKDYEDLYNWTNLLNNVRPISCYTLNRNLNIQNNKKTSTNNNKKNLKHTIIECEYKKDELKQNSKILIKKNHDRKFKTFRRSQSNNTSYLYYSKTINDYYKDNLKIFLDRQKILKPKLKSHSYRLKQEIKTQRLISARKEKELNNRLNTEQISLKQKDIINATKRNNPKPLLKSLFRQFYDDEKIINENGKKYYNTMKPLPWEKNRDMQVDYTKNDRTRWIEEIKRMRMQKKLKFNKSDLEEYNNGNYNNNLNEEKKLILSYYNKNDAYIQIFNRIISKNLNKIDNEKKEKEEIFYNPILQKFDDNFNPKKMAIINEDKQNSQIIKNNYEENKEKLNKNQINKNLKNIRPKTGFRPANAIINNPWAKRPQTSNYRNNNLESIDTKLNLEDNSKYYESYADFGYSSSTSIPIKTTSNFEIISYDKINKESNKRKICINDLKYDNSNSNINKE